MELQEFLSGHAISEEIGGRGRYVRFEQGDSELVASYFAPFGKKALQHGRNVAGQSGGFIIVRRGWGSPVPPQLRPDNPVSTNGAPLWSFHPANPYLVKGDGSRGLRFARFQDKKGKWQTVFALPESALEKHLRKYDHSGINTELPHLHEPRPAKYTIPPGRDESGTKYGRRLDVPSPERIASADRVFFVIEGSLKTDAILSQGEAAFGVPSVTLWDTPELDEFITAMNLRSKQVVIIPDADWVANPMVIGQAMMCRTYLRDRGVAGAVVAAPMLTEQERQVLRELPCSLDSASADDIASISERLGIDESVVALCLTNIKDKKGVDDFLHAGYSLNELSVLEREPPDRQMLWRALRYHHSGRQSRAMHAATRFSLHADESGRLLKNVSMLAKIMGRNRTVARAAVVDLQAAELVDVEGSIEAGFQYEDKRTGTWHDYDWNHRPTITIKPEFRASSDRFIPLRDLPAIEAGQRKDRACQITTSARTFGRTSLTAS
jgi:hypothetical protein